MNITLVNGDWFRGLPDHVRRQFLRNLFDTVEALNINRGAGICIRVKGQHWVP